MRNSVSVLVAGLLLQSGGLAAQQELRVTQVLPEGSLRPSSTISLSFNRPVSGTLEALVDPSTVARVSASVAVRLEWRDPATIRIVPRAPLRPGSSVLVTIDTTFVASDGSHLRVPYVARFDVAAPAMVGSVPPLTAQGTVALDPYGRVSMRFSGDIDSVAFARNARLEPTRGGSCTSREAFHLIPKIRPPSTTDPWQLQYGGGPRDSLDQRFDQVVELRSATRLPDNCQVDLVLPQLEPNSTIETRYRATTPPPLQFTVACSIANDCAGSTRLMVQFSAPVTYAQVRTHVRVMPERFAAPPDSGEAQTHWAFVLHMPARDSVIVVADSSLTDVFGRTLQRLRTQTTRSGDRLPFIASSSGLETESRAGDPVLRLRSMNYASVRITVTRVPTGDRFAAVADPRAWLDSKHILPRQSLAYTERLPHELNTEGQVTLPLRLPATSWRDAVLVVEVRPGDLARGPNNTDLELAPEDLRVLREQERWIQPLVIQRTNLMAHVRSGVGGGAAFVTDVRTGRPVTGATVRALVDKPRREVARRTAADGTTLLPALPSRGNDDQAVSDEIDATPPYDMNPPFTTPSFVEVSSGSDRSITPVSPPYRIFDYARRASGLRWFGGGQTPHARAAIFTDRGIYRPGETVYFSAVVRDGWLDDLRPPAAKERIRWRVYTRGLTDGKPVLVRETTTTLSANGTAADSARLSPRTQLGTYVVRLERRQNGHWANAHEAFVRVADYRAPEFTVTAAIVERPVLLGDTVRTSVAARFLFDAPMAQGAVTWRAQLTEPTQPWRIPGVDGWTIGRQPDWYTDDRQATPPISQTGRAVLGPDGQVQLTIPTDSGRGHFASGAALHVDVAVSDLNAQSVSAQASVMIPGAQFFIAAKPRGERSWWTTADTQRVAIGAVTPQGRWMSGVTVGATVVRRRWTVVYDEGSMSGQWRVQLDTVLVDSIVTRDTSATIQVKPSAEGLYSIILSAVDAAGRPTQTQLTRYVFGGTGAVWGEDPTALPLLVSYDSLKVGDVAAVTFTSPFENAEAWITVERERVLWQARRSVGAGLQTIRVPVNASWIPNAYVGVVLVRRGDAARTDSTHQRYRVGDVRVHVDASPRRLKVAVSAAKPEYRPQDEAELTVRVRDANDKPITGDVILWATDEGVLSLTGFATPQPVDAMYPLSANDVQFSTTLQSLARQLLRERRLGLNESLRLDAVVTTAAPMAFAKGAAAAASDQTGAFADIRADFLTTAFYRAGIVANTDGIAKVRVRLPDNITTFRVMAIAVGPGAELGSGDAPLIVSKPLVVRAALPRFVRPADDFFAGAIINARGNTAAQSVQVAAAGDGIELTDSTRKTSSVSQEGRLVSFHWKALAGERAVVKLGAIAGQQQDAVQVTLPVRPDQHPRAQTVVRLVRDSANLQLLLPKGVDPARSRLTIRVGTTPLPVLETYAWYMSAYPHACTEQLVSAGRTIIALLQLHKSGQAPKVKADSLQRALQGIADLVARRQLPDGSIGYWSASSWTNPWLTAYAGLMLVDARELGIQVSNEVLTQVGNFVQNVFDGTPALPDTTYGTTVERAGTIAMHLGQRLAALDFLVRVGRSGRELALLPVVNRLTWEDRARYALVLSRTSRRSEATSILRSLWTSVSVAGNRVDMPDSTLITNGFPSRIRPAARLLEATLALAPDHPMVGPLVQRIIQRELAEQRWFWNTQDFASASGAVAAHLRLLSGRSTPYTIESTTGTSLMRGEQAEGVTESTIPLTGLMVAAGDSSSLPLVVRVPRGTIYVAATVDVVTAERPVSPESNGLIVERWYERFDDGKTVTEVKAGDLVRVRLRVTAPSDREFVAVEDPLPAGLEAVDVSLRTASVSPYLTDDAVRVDRERAAQADGAANGNAWRWWGWSWTTWEASEQHDDRATFYSRLLSRGSHTVSYVARATTAGRFVRPQAHAEEMYNPALRGQSDGGWFTIRDR